MVARQTWTKGLSRPKVSISDTRSPQPQIVTSTTAQHRQTTEAGPACDRWVRVWFGSHVVNEYGASQAQAEEYAEAMRRRFRGLRVTVDPPPPAVPRVLESLPGRRLWELAP